ncbi:MAG: HAMP domain-containing histidine kinase [Clostridia bacterium]|nr:HAMP domain-containing histidine kinase [Clostridia bacterium]
MRNKLCSNDKTNLEFNKNINSEDLFLTVLKNLDELASCEPFCIFSSSNNIIFKSKGFLEIQKRMDCLDSVICEELLKNNVDSFEYMDISISAKKIITFDCDNKLFFVFIKKTVGFENSEAYSIIKCCHDIMAPLRNISNFLQIIKLHLDDVNDNFCNEYIKYAIENIEYLGGFAIGMLQKNNIVSHSCFNINKEISRLEKLLKTQFEKRKCIIKVENGDVNLIADYYQIFSLFKNLIENALNHAITKDRLIITLSISENEDETVTILFGDNGEKLPKETEDFIKFHLENGSTGSGNFGIAICGSVVRNHLGKINLINSSSGCNYRIILPKYKRS